MAATSWQPAFDQGVTGSRKVTTAYVDDGRLVKLLQQTALPYTMSALTPWLFAEVGFEMPPLPHTVYPPNDGRGFPAHS